MLPKVSIVVPMYNAEKYLSECIDSVLAQSYQFWELILVNDGSEDESISIANSYINSHSNTIRLLRESEGENIGASAARNIGAYASDGPLIAFLDADDVWNKNILQSLVNAWLIDTDIGMVYCSALYWNSWNSLASNAKDFHYTVCTDPTVYKTPALFVDSLMNWEVRMPCIGALVVTHALFKKIQGFEPKFKTVYTDQVLFSKIFLHSNCTAIPFCGLKYRQHNFSSTAQLSRPIDFLLSRRKYLSWVAAYLKQSEIEKKYLLMELVRQKRVRLFFEIIRNRVSRILRFR